MLHRKFRLILTSGFRREDCIVIDQPVTQIAYVGHAYQQIETKRTREVIPYMLSTKFPVHLAKRFQMRRLSDISLPETRIAYDGNIC
jgi:hypothetical protein